ncbi:MAG: hypothetical protein R8P61_22980 [Bacteroidia bacterium]|nr:hypothetical protein [Bacteroidia bacterium]
MKKIQVILLFLLFLNYLPAQKSHTISKLIEGIPTTDSLHKDINLLWGHFDIDKSQLLPFKKDLSKSMNQVLAKKSSPFNVFHFALELSNADLLKINKAADQHIIATQQRIREVLKQDADYQQWIWDDSVYNDLRYQSGVLLDLMSHLKSKASTVELLASYSHFQDTRLKFFALKSLLEKGIKVSPASFLSIAEADESRELLFELLETHEMLEQFPQKYKNQEALSRSDMVNWLVYPTELGRIPDEIELMEVISINYEDVGETEYYLWKFRSDTEAWKEEGWMVGMSGPYVKKESPSTKSYGHTFSQFSKLEEMTPQEHFEHIMEILNKAYEEK